MQLSEHARRPPSSFNNVLGHVHSVVVKEVGDSADEITDRALAYDEMEPLNKEIQERFEQAPDTRPAVRPKPASDDYVRLKMGFRGKQRPLKRKSKRRGIAAKVRVKVSYWELEKRPCTDFRQLA